MTLAIVTDEPARLVISDPSHRFEGKRRAQPGEILEHIVRRPTVAGKLAPNVRECVLGRPAIDQLDVIDDPVAASDDAVARAHSTRNGGAA